MHGAPPGLAQPRANKHLSLAEGCLSPHDHLWPFPVPGLVSSWPPPPSPGRPCPSRGHPLGPSPRRLSAPPTSPRPRPRSPPSTSVGAGRAQRTERSAGTGQPGPPGLPGMRTTSPRCAAHLNLAVTLIPSSSPGPARASPLLSPLPPPPCTHPLTELPLPERYRPFTFVFTPGRTERAPAPHPTVRPSSAAPAPPQSPPGIRP